MKRNHDIVIKLNVEEKERLINLAEELNIKTGTLAREILLSVMKFKEIIPKIFLNSKIIKTYGRCNK